MLSQISIHVADAFSLDLDGEGENTRLMPVLHRAGQYDEPLLPEPLHEAFVCKQFNGFGDARAVYALPNGNFLVLRPPLRRALSVVRRIQSAPPAARRAMFAYPRLYLRDALGDEEETLIENVFRETRAYSDRVIGLGLWQPRVVPWVQVATNDWFGGAEMVGRAAAPLAAGLRVGDTQVELTPDEAHELRDRVEQAIATGQTSVELPRPDGPPVAIPASHEVLTALARIEQPSLPSRSGGAPAEPLPVEVLLIRPNEDTLEIEAAVSPRTEMPAETPMALATAPKQHQRDGLAWLQRAWTEGVAGVLLADDMGLGKTLQGLAFLAWLRSGMEAGILPREPVLIVAPTGLLANWQKEHVAHLSAPGLGTCVLAYGQTLRLLRRSDADGRPGLDTATLGRANWVLTTYETLRDYDRDFGQVRFAAAIFDEAQKIKTPGIRLTDAAKGMNARFRIALTGTPVENRLSDLWCIIDTANPGYLGDLKTFSREYEQREDPDRLVGLRKKLDSPSGNRPPLMLRRLRRDHLPDVPKQHEKLHEQEMPPPQAAAYTSAIAQAREGGRGNVLAALQRLRAASLHPDPDGDLDDEAFIAASARFISAFSILDEIAANGERLLLFVDDLGIQARLTGLLQRRYGLSAAPMVINGTVAGSSRQARVDRFQTAADRFDVMILSPRAGGVGLTLTRANHVIHLSRWWNPAVEDQCNGRALRIGQTRQVTVHIPLATLSFSRGRSFDQNLHALLERKRRLMHEALLPPEATESERKQLLEESLAGAPG
jgi:SNF2-related domain/Helicase conserved C-terminal domain